MRVISEIDEKQYGLLCKVDEVKPLMEALSRLYRKIWCEACYDPTNAGTEQFSRGLLADIEFANTILGFRK
jgi:hypothetical protein